MKILKGDKMKERELDVVFVSAVHEQLNRTGWTQKELADRAGVGVSTVNEIVKGRGTYSFGTWIKLAQAFGFETVLSMFRPEVTTNNADRSFSPAIAEIAAALEGIRLLNHEKFIEIGARIKTTVEFLREQSQDWNGNDRRHGDRRQMSAKTGDIH